MGGSSLGAGGEVIAVRRGALGDTVLFLPVLAALRRAFPGAPILFAGHGDYAPLALRAGLADRVVSADAWPPLREWYRDPSRLPLAWAKARFVLLEADRDEDQGRVRLFDPHPEPGVREPLSRQLLRRLRLPHEWPPPVWPGLLGPPGEGAGRILLHPGAGGRERRWPAACFARLGRCLARQGERVGVILGPVEEEWGPGSGLFPPPLEVHRLRGLDDLCRLLAGARRLIGNDSGPAHLAAAGGVPVTVLFGPSDPAVWAPCGVTPTIRKYRGRGPGIS